MTLELEKQITEIVYELMHKVVKNPSMSDVTNAIETADKLATLVRGKEKAAYEKGWDVGVIQGRKERTY